MSVRSFRAAGALLERAERSQCNRRSTSVRTMLSGRRERAGGPQGPLRVRVLPSGKGPPSQLAASGELPSLPAAPCRRSAGPAADCPPAAAAAVWCGSSLPLPPREY